MSALDDIEQRLAAATPGPWSMENVQRMPDGLPGLYADIEPMIAGGVDPLDAELIAHAPTDLAALVAFARTVSDHVNDGHNAHDPAYDEIRDLLNVLEQS
jgi:hypothetical protein